MMDGNTLLRLDIEPIDTLFFRDARPFEAASRGESGRPMPQTLAGAIRTLLLERHGVDFGRLGEQMRHGVPFAQALAEFSPAAAAVAAVRIRGPYFTLCGEVLVPAPASLRREKETGKLMRIDPRKIPPPGWRPKTPGMRPLWRHGRETVEAADGFLKPSGLRCFLDGGTPGPDALVLPDKVYGFDNRTGIGVDPSRNTAAESLIYAVKMLVLRREAGLYAEVRGPIDALTPLIKTKDEPILMRFGGEGRHVAVRSNNQGADWPAIPPSSNTGRLVLMTTPAYFAGWKPPAFEPVAAAVGSGQAVSGWDLAQGGPKPNRFMVPAGSVYFLQPNAQIPAELVADDDASVGWGCFLEGNWNYA